MYTMADIYLNFPSPPSGYVRGDIECDLEDLIGENGRISGGGAEVGNPGFNIDLELFTDDKAKVEAILGSIVRYLRSLPVVPGTNLVMIVGDEEPEHRAV
jgi:hypothetical protein